MVSITNREELKDLITVFRENGAGLSFVSLGHGTALLDSTPKAVTYTVITTECWQHIKRDLEQKMDIDLPNKGIVFTTPVSSAGSMMQLTALLGNKPVIPGEESVLKDTVYELVMVIANPGFSVQIMNAARKGGAQGGTVIHAKGTGEKGNEDFLGITLAAEKEIVYTVVKKDVKNDVMKCIIEECGPGTRPDAVLMSVPVTSTAGMRFYEMKEREPEAEEMTEE